MGVKKGLFLTIGLFFFLRFASPAYGAVPKIINYQGRLTDENDVLYDGTIVYMKFEIYDSLSGGSELWSSDEDNGGGSETCGVTVEPESGVFNVLVGDTGLSYMADLDQDFNTVSYYLQLKVQEGAQCPVAEGNYETLSPRQRIVSSGYAINAETTDGADASAAPVADQIPILDTNGDLVLGSAAGNDDDIIYFDDGSTEYIKWDDGNSGFYFSDDLLVEQFIYHAGDSDTFLNFESTDDLQIDIGGYDFFHFEGDAAQRILIGNYSNQDVDFRWDGDTNDNLLFLDAASEYVGVGGVPSVDRLEVNGNLRLQPTGDSYVYFDNGAENLMWDDAAWPAGASIGDAAGFILTDDFALEGNIIKNVASTNLVIDSHGASADLIFQTGGSNKATLDSLGYLTLNDTTNGYLVYGSIPRPTGATALNYYDSSTNMMEYYDGGISYWRSMQGVTAEVYSPEYPSSVIAADGSDNAGTLITGSELDSNNLYTFYRWTTIKADDQDYDIYIHLRIPDNFQSWASNAMTLNFKTGLTTTANNSVQWWIYEDGNAVALMSSAAMASGVANTWTSDSATNTELEALTAGNTYYILIKLLADSTASAAAYTGKIIVSYR